MTHSTDQLEQDVEARRADVERTLDRIKDSFSVNRMMDSVGQFVGIDDVRGTLSAAGERLKENPVALGLIGAGIAWMAIGPSIRSSRTDSDEVQDRAAFGYSPGTASGNGGGIVAGAKDKVAALGEATKRHASGAVSAVSDMAETVRSGAVGVVDKAAALRGEAEDRIVAYPLAAAAMAFAAGAAIGAALPRTRIENRVMGSGRESLMKVAGEATRELGEKAREAAGRVLSTAAETARDEGLLPSDGKTMAEKVETVARAAVSEAGAVLEEGAVSAEAKIGEVAGDDPTTDSGNVDTLPKPRKSRSAR